MTIAVLAIKPGMKQRWRPSFIAQVASIWFAWICWGLACWRGHWWLLVLSFVPHLLVNRFGHRLDGERR